MMFLKNLAQDIIRDAEQGKRILVLVPNKRAGIFLRREIQTLVSKPVFAPDILSSEAFASEITGLVPADHVSLIILLYELYIEEIKKLDLVRYQAVPGEDGVLGTKLPDLGDFFGIGAVLLKDFDEIDRYCVDSDALFSEMSQVGKDSALSENFRTLWSSAGGLYKKFREAALARAQVYTGLIYRMAVESLADRELPYDKVYWAGLYACTESEKKLIAVLKNKFREAFKVYLDLDTYYCMDENQEAGDIYRKFWKPNYAKDVPVEFSSKEINIETVSVQGGTGMAKFAGTVLNAMPGSKNDDEIPSVALILPDASLLFPVLNSIPEQFKHINVTMGLPFRSTRLYSFCMLLFKIHDSVSANDNRIFIDDFSELISNPYFESLCAEEVLLALREVYETHVRENNAYLKAALLSPVPHVALFINAENAQKAMQALTDLGGTITARYLDSASPPELKIVYEGWQSLVNLGHKLESFGSLGVPQLKKIIDTVFSSQGIAFTGEPLKGLQVMGMLETQCLAFDTVIFLSANEGLLPFQSSGTSLIPDSVRRIVDLPSSAASDAVTAYHFYRLISHAKHVYLVYSENSELQGKDEPSRFIQQLRLEYVTKNSRCKFEQRSFRYPVAKVQIKPIVVPNTEDIRAKILEKPLSPSVLSLYSACPLRFYYAHVLGLKETETVSEDPDAALVGNIFHSTLESLFDKKEYNIEILYNELEPLVNEAADQAIRKHLPHTRFTGNHYMLRRATHSLIRRFVAQLQQELRRMGASSYTVLEKEYSLSVPLKLRGGQSITFKGKIDHLAHIGNRYFVIDYKTGNTSAPTLGMNPDGTFHFDELKDHKRKELLQLLCYALLLSKDKTTRDAKAASPFMAECSLYCFRAKEPFKKFAIKAGRSTTNIVVEDLAVAFSTWLTEYCQSILDIQAFKQTPDVKQCKFCPYAAVCMR